MKPVTTDVLRDAIQRIRQLQADIELFPNGDVKQVNFVGTAVDDEVLATVALFSQLQRLYLGATRVTDAGMKHLEGLKNLEYLGLHGTDVTAECMQQLRAKLPNCQVCPRGDRSGPSLPTQPAPPTRIEIPVQSTPTLATVAEPANDPRDGFQQELLRRVQSLELEITALRRLIEKTIDI